MQFNLNGSNLGERELIVIQSITRLFEGEAIVHPIPFEAWVAWVFASFDTAKESLERKFYTFLNILQNLRMNFTKPGFIYFPYREQFVRVIQGQTLARLFVGIFANTQRIIVDPTTNTKRSIKLGALGRCWEQAILVGQSHVS